MPVTVTQSIGTGTVAPTWDPDPKSVTLLVSGTIEASYGGAIDSTTVTSTTVKLYDDVTGFEYSPTLSVVTGTNNSRIVIVPDQRLEYENRVRVEINGVKLSGGQTLPVRIERWDVETRLRPGVMYDRFYLDFWKDKVSTGSPPDQPWLGGYNYSGVSSHPYDTSIRAEAIAHSSRTPGPTQSPNIDDWDTYDEWREAYVAFTGDMIGCIASALTYHASSDNTYRDQIGSFIMAWVDNLSITPTTSLKTKSGWFWTVLWAEIPILQMMVAADLMWDVADVDGFGDNEKSRFLTTLRTWADSIAIDWVPSLEADDYEPANISTWTSSTMLCIGKFLNERRISAWAFDDDKTPSGYPTHNYHLDHCYDNTLLSTGAYKNESDRENRSNSEGQGYTYGLFNLAP